MDDPKRRVWLYLISGTVAIIAALYFMTIETTIFDWAILIGGVVVIVQGIREYLKLRAGDGKE